MSAGSTVTVAQGNQSQLLIKKQTALGTVATGNFNQTRFQTHDIRTSIGTLQNNEIRNDREVQDVRHGNRHGTANIVSPLMYGDHDTLIESAMFNTFGSDSLRLGTDPQYLSVEDAQTDISQYRLGCDLICNTMSINVSATATEPVQATWDLIGTDVGDPQSTSQGGTPILPSDNSPFDQFTGSLYDDDALSGAEVGVVTAMDFTINNNVAPVFVVGQKTAPFLEFGRAEVTGNLSIYYNDTRWLDRFLNETEVPLLLTLTDPDGNSMEFRFPRIKLLDGGVPVANEQSRVITAPFQALREKTAGGSALQITKA
jgi:hypothetical protein